MRKRPTKTRESIVVAAEPQTAETTGANECWAARATWLKDTPDRPTLSAGARWERLITNGRSVSGDHGSLAKAVRAELARVAASNPAARPVKLVQAAFVRPPFFRDRAGILLVHVSGRGMRSDRRRYDAILFAVKHAPTSKSWKVTSYNFKSAALHQLNTEAPLVAERSPLAYMRYFMHVVRGPEGPFRLVDEPEPSWPFSPKNLQLLKDRAARAGARVEDSLYIPKFDGIDYAGRLRYKVCVLYSGHFFAADVAIHHGGLVEMVSDRPIAEIPELKE